MKMEMKLETENKAGDTRAIKVPRRETAVASENRYNSYSPELQAIFTGTPLMRLAISMEALPCETAAREKYLKD